MSHTLNQVYKSRCSEGMKFIIYPGIKEEPASTFSRKLVKFLQKRHFDIFFFCGDGNNLSHLANNMYLLSLRKYEEELRTNFLAFITLAL